MTFRIQAVLEEARNKNLVMLQTVCLGKGKPITAYSERILALGIELEYAGHATSKIEQKRALLTGLATKFEVSVERIIGSETE